MTEKTYTIQGDIDDWQKAQAEILGTLVSVYSDNPGSAWFKLAAVSATIALQAVCYFCAWVLYQVKK